MYSSSDAFKKWEAENSLQVVQSIEELYRFNLEEHRQLISSKPWANDSLYFKRVKISVLALTKMLMRANEGKNIEVMGMVLGKVDGDTFIISDCFSLPVMGTETTVNAQESGYEYMSSYIQHNRQVGRDDAVIGWYHSHPGYGCWLSGIDVNTQIVNQTYQEPFVAIVVDHIRSAAQNKAVVGAFRTLPPSYTKNSQTDEYQNVPLDKIEDFGVHSHMYYSLEVSYFKSVADQQILEYLWNSSWMQTLAGSSLNFSFVNSQLKDISKKLENILKNDAEEQALSQFCQTEITRDQGYKKFNKDCTQLSTQILNNHAEGLIRKAVFRLNE